MIQRGVNPNSEHTPRDVLLKLWQLCGSPSHGNTALGFTRSQWFCISTLLDLALGTSLSPHELLRDNFTLICRYKVRYPPLFLFLVFHSNSKNFIFFFYNAFLNYFQHFSLSFISQKLDYFFPHTIKSRLQELKFHLPACATVSKTPISFCNIHHCDALTIQTAKIRPRIYSFFK